MSAREGYPEDRAGLIFCLRRSVEKNGVKYLVWHMYKTKERRDFWAAQYVRRGNLVWMNEDGSMDGLFFLRESEAING